MAKRNVKNVGMTDEKRAEKQRMDEQMKRLRDLRQSRNEKIRGMQQKLHQQQTKNQMMQTGGGVDMNKKILSYLKSMQTSEAKKILAKYDKAREEQGYYGNKPAIHVFTIDNIVFDGKKYSARVQQTYSYPNFTRKYGEIPSIWELDLRNEGHKGDIASFVFTKDKWTEVSKKLQNTMYADGGGVDDYTKNLARVKVKFANPKYNYETSVSGDITEQEARKYFVGQTFDMGVYPKENMQKVTDIEFFAKGTYSKGGKMAFGGMVNDLPEHVIERMDGLVLNDELDRFLYATEAIVKDMENEGFEKDETLSFLASKMVQAAKDMYKTGGYVKGDDIVFNRYDESTEGTIHEKLDDGNFVVYTDNGVILVEPRDITGRAKKRLFGIFNNGGNVAQGAAHIYVVLENGDIKVYHGDDRKSLLFEKRNAPAGSWEKIWECLRKL